MSGTAANRNAGRAGPIVRQLLRLATAAAMVWALAVAAVAAGQEWLIFRPGTLPPDHRFNVPSDVHETWVEVPGARLNALHLRLPAPDGVVFFLHGNGGHLGTWFVNPALYRRLNLDLFMIDYRGYGKSTGRIRSEAELHDDVRRAWAHVAPAYAGQRTVFFGRSLGTGLAAALAAEVQPDALVLVAPFESLSALAGEHYPWVPGALLRYPLRTDEALPRVRGEITLIHGERDTLIPIEHAERLAAQVPRSRLVRIAGAGHGDLQAFDAYQAALAQALGGAGR
jgi:hypothetical protein